MHDTITFLAVILLFAWTLHLNPSNDCECEQPSANEFELLDPVNHHEVRRGNLIYRVNNQ